MTNDVTNEALLPVSKKSPHLCLAGSFLFVTRNYGKKTIEMNSEACPCKRGIFS